MAYNFSELKKNMAEIESWLTKEFASIRTGRATPSILDNVKIESYGSQMPINQVASVSMEGPKTLRITPWDSSVNKSIEKAIVESNLGLSVALDEKGVRVMFPDLTSERREQLVKVAKQKLEEARISIRKERDATWDDIQEKEKQGGMGEDEKFRLKAEMQKIVDEAGKKFQTMAEKKEQEVMN
jgi:ribosome recycling factor